MCASVALPQQGLPKSSRLRKRFEFVSVQRRGVRASVGALVLIARSCRNQTAGRVGFTVPKKVGPAVVRNLIKRRLRHLAGAYQCAFAQRDLVVLALRRSAEISFRRLRQDFARACSLLNKKMNNKQSNKRRSHG
ncbi:MAG: ribonuclease P protein component [Myxococcota bacterium]